jgi:glucose/arabinose dehydrogenase
LDVRTSDGGGSYDPYAPGAPVTIHARGIRNNYDLVWHSNGQLYAPVNGSSAGGSVPSFVAGGMSRPGIENLRYTEPDFLIRVERGAYYGHPVPVRGESVLNGGNPTADRNSFEVPVYPVGVEPDKDYRQPVYHFGKHLSPNGVLEYREPAGSPFGGVLNGKLLVTRFSGGKDIIVLTPGGSEDGFAITEAMTGIEGLSGFDEPLDLAQDPATGNVYVAEHAGERITFLRPRPGGVSARVYQQRPLEQDPPAPAPDAEDAAEAAGPAEQRAP